MKITKRFLFYAICGGFAFSNSQFIVTEYDSLTHIVILTQLTIALIFATLALKEK